MLEMSDMITNVWTVWYMLYIECNAFVMHKTLWNYFKTEMGQYK